MLLTNFPDFTSFENVIIASPPLKDSFTGYRMQVHSSFIWAFEKVLPSGLPCCWCCHLNCFSAVGKVYFLSHCFYDVFLVSRFQKLGYDCLCIHFIVYPVWSLLSMLHLYISVFCQIWKVFKPLFLQIPFQPCTFSPIL